MSQNLATNVYTYANTQGAVVYLLVDDDTEVAIGERPIFGIHVTIDEKLFDSIGKILPSGTVIGWLDYVTMNKFGCVNQDKHYVDASKYFVNHSNQLQLCRPAELLDIDKDMQTTKRLLQCRFTKASNQTNV